MKPLNEYFYSEEQVAFVKRHNHLMRKDIVPLFIKKFGCGDMTLSRIEYICGYYGFRNSGKVRLRVAPIGTEYRTKKGVLVKVREASEGSPYTFKHKILWEQMHGTIPANERLKCIDGNKFNTDPSNWVSVPIGIMSRLRKRGFATAPPELKQSILTVAMLEHQIHSQGKDGKLTEAQRAFLSILARHNTVVTKKRLPPVDRRENKVRESCRCKGYAIFGPWRSGKVNGWRITPAGRRALSREDW